MPMISDKDREHIKKMFSGKLPNPVKLVVFTQEFECQYCKENREIAEELAMLSDKIAVQTYDFMKDQERAKDYGVDKIPAMVILGETDHHVKYYGVPAGYEFTSLIDDIIDVSQRKTGLSESTKQKLKAIDKPVHIQVFITPTCPYCPRAVRTAHQFAMENQLIHADMVESTEFPELSNKYSVMAVPKIVINENVEFEGAMPEQIFLSKVEEALSSAS
ncbi:MAG: thioredoxin family protein [Nitrososphaerota archaeon]|nr:thioredoxin family protein [Nitrososphaerota archaeon]